MAFILFYWELEVSFLFFIFWEIFIFYFFEKFFKFFNFRTPKYTTIYIKNKKSVSKKCKFDLTQKQIKRRKQK